MYDRGVTMHAKQVVNRRTLVGGAVVAGVLGRIFPVLALPATPAGNQAEGDAEALEVLKAASGALLSLNTFTFEMTTVQGQSTIMPQVELQSVTGAVRRPMDLTATLKVKAMVATVELSAVSVDGEFWVQNPIGGEWMSVGQASEIANMINPDWIVAAMINLIKDAKITSTKNNQTLIEGWVNLYETLADYAGENADLSQVSEYLAKEPVDVAFWINDEHMLVQSEIYGPIFSSESPDVEKRIEFANFNEPVEIEKPEAAG